MWRAVGRSRLALPLPSRRNAPFRPYSDASASASDLPAASAGLDPTRAAATPSEGAVRKRLWSWGLLKFGIFSAIAAGVGTASYATYAYTSDELDEKTKSFRSSSNNIVADDASNFERYETLLYSTAMKLPAKIIELYLHVRRSTEEQIQGFTEPSSEKLLPDLHPQEQHVFTLVLDLNETLVYSDWTRERGWQTFKRPGVEAFLEHLSQFYEIVVYSDQLNVYVDPVVDRLDTKGWIRYRLSRAATKYVDGKHYRDLSKLNRNPSQVLYVSGHACESSLQPENCVPLRAWKLEADDTALVDLIPFLEYVARSRPLDIRPVLASFEGQDVAAEFIERSKEYQRRMQGQRKQGRLWSR